MKKEQDKYSYKDVFAITIALYKSLMPRILTIALGLIIAMILLRVFL